MTNTLNLIKIPGNADCTKCYFIKGCNKSNEIVRKMKCEVGRGDEVKFYVWVKRK